MKSEPGRVFGSAVLSFGMASVIAAHDIHLVAGWSTVGVYLYWYVRMAVTFAIVLSIFVLEMHLLSRWMPRWGQAVLCAVISFIPVTVCVVTIDLLIGDVTLLRTSPKMLQAHIIKESFNMLEEHITATLLLLLPFFRPGREISAAGSPDEKGRPEGRP